MVDVEIGLFVKYVIILSSHVLSRMELLEMSSELFFIL